MKRFLVFSVLFAALFVVVPEVDLWVESLFYAPEEGFFLGDTLYARFWYEVIPILRNWVVIPACLALLIAWGIRRRPPMGIDSRALLLFVLTLGIGSGLLVNVVFKDQWGRARPRDIVEFGGSREFTPAFVMTDQCDRNCSFVSGHPSLIFTAFSVALVSTRRKRAVFAVAALGGMAGLGRLMQGAHFLSDVVFSGVFMFLVAWGLYRILYRGDREGERPSGSETPLSEAP